MPATSGDRLCVLHPAAQPTVRRGGVLFVHSFAEEMNKSRRMVALQASALAEAGWDVLLMDLFGCGDSSGDHGDATWDGWHADIETGQRWLASRSNGPVWLWGLRVGALLAVSAASRSSQTSSLLLWQPVVSGHRFVQQFLRSRAISDMLGDGDSPRASTSELLAELAAGRRVEVAGYTLGPDLVIPLDRATMPALPPGSRIRWLDVSNPDRLEHNPASLAVLHGWQAEGVDVAAEVVSGPPFWQTQEISECASLISASLSLLHH